MGLVWMACLRDSKGFSRTKQPVDTFSAMYSFQPPLGYVRLPGGSSTAYGQTSWIPFENPVMP